MQAQHCVDMVTVVHGAIVFLTAVTTCLTAFLAREKRRDIARRRKGPSVERRGQQGHTVEGSGTRYRLVQK